jgi:hypothetical protein
LVPCSSDLGDTKSRAALYVGKQTGYWRDSFAATRGSWVAFYPHIDQSGPKDEAYLSRRPRYDRASVELVGTDAEWIAARDVKDIPFYSLDHTTDTLRWKHERHEEDYTGNESSGIREARIVSISLMPS